MTRTRGRTPVSRSIAVFSAGLTAAVAVALTTLLSGPPGAADSSANASANGTASGDGGWTVTECGTYSGTGCSPQQERVDLRKPVFSHPTQITNPWFPISRLHSVVQLGTVDGKAFRSETTLLPGTATVRWDGQHIRVLRSQYLAYLDGRIEEIAIDRYAQADDGSVWYLGEDVFDYRGGAVAITEGTWLAGRDGPPAMIMPARPKVGDVFRAENVIGVVFEEVRITQVARTVPGPRGPVSGAITGQELHLDGSHSDKTFAPGYGEFRTESGGELEAMAIAVPVDAVNTPVPADLGALTTAAWGILESGRLDDWEAAKATVKRMNARWAALRAQPQPVLIGQRMTRALRELNVAVQRQRRAPVAQAAIDVAQSALDLQLRNRPPVEIDIERIHLHSQQLRVHAAAKDAAGTIGEVAVMEWLADRVGTALDPPGQHEIATGLRDLRAASDTGNLAATADHAARLAARLRDLAAGQR